MTFDRTSWGSLGLAVGLHSGLILLLGSLALRLEPVAQVPMLIEVTLAGTSAPRSATEGQQAPGEVVAPRGEAAEVPSPTQEQVEQWKAQQRQRLIQELADTREGLRIGVTRKELRSSATGLAQGRGAGTYGQPGSLKGSLSLTGAIATRGFEEPDFSVLKDLISEETQLRLTVVVLPNGQVKRADLLETSGYPPVDQKAIDLARKILFDPLPADWKPVDQQGVLTIKLKL